MVRDLLARLGEHGALALALGLLLGLLAPGLSALARPALVPALLVPLVIALLRVDVARLRSLARRPLLFAALFAWLLLGSPLLTRLVGEVLLRDPELARLLVLHAACAPVLASAALALLLGLDVELALLGSVGATLLIPLILPATALVLGVWREALAPSALTLRLAAMLVGCYLLAAALRRGLGELRLLHHARMLDGIAVIALLIFALAVMDGVRPLLEQRPRFALEALAATFALALGLQLAGVALFARLGRRAALTVGLLSGFGNMGILLAAAVDAVGDSFLAYVALAQFPIYLLPALEKPFIAWWLACGEPR